MNYILALRPPATIKYILSWNWRLILKISSLLSILLIITLVVIYVFQITAEVSGRNSIQEYSRKLNESAIENQKLQFNLVQGNSLSNIAVLMEELNFEKVEQIHYIRVLDNKVVTK